TFNSFIDSLIRNDVYPVIRHNAEGRIYGITFVDHQSKCVFNRSDLGKQYSAKAILDRLSDKPTGKVEILPTRFSRSTQTDAEAATFVPSHHATESGIISTIVGAHLDKSDVDSNLKKKRKKKKGRSI